MYGRNGMDQMNQILLWVYLALCILRALLVMVTKSALLARIGDLLITVMAVYLLFRMFSKNLPKRREENQKFMSRVWKLKNSAAGAKARRADRDHKYLTCKCGTVCRLSLHIDLIGMFYVETIRFKIAFSHIEKIIDTKPEYTEYKYIFQGDPRIRFTFVPDDFKYVAYHNQLSF